MLDRDCQGYNCTLALFGTALPIFVLLPLFGSPTPPSPPQPRCLEADQNLQGKLLDLMSQKDWAKSKDFAVVLGDLREAGHSCVSGKTDEAMARFGVLEQKLTLLEASPASRRTIAYTTK
jgi:hypothetical protein